MDSRLGVMCRLSEREKEIYIYIYIYIEREREREREREKSIDIPKREKRMVRMHEKCMIM